jgi:PhoPQ-activated pathogenicity-related protein
MAIDVLEMEVHLEYQIAVWGEYSEQIRDYIERGIHEELDTKRGQALVTMVDPIRYRERFTMSKLLVIGTNDPYWPLDALNLTVRSDLRPDRVRAWTARTPTRDFREAEWTSRPCEALEEGAWHCHLHHREEGEGYAALFAEIVHPGVFLLPLHLSTQVRVVKVVGGDR